MNKIIGFKETIKPLSDVIIPIKNGTKHVIEGLVSDTGAKTVETYLTRGPQKAISLHEVILPDGGKSSFLKKTTPEGISRVWKHSGDSKVSTFSNLDGDLLSFEAKGRCNIVTPDESHVELWTMHNDAHNHRKEIEIARAKNILQNLVPNFFKF